MASTISAQTSGGGGIVTAGDASGVIQLQTNGTPTVTVDTSGNVGVGTASPGFKLDIQNSANFSAQLKTTAGNFAQWSIVGNAGTSNFGTDNVGGYVQTVGAIPLLLYTNSAERMRIDSSGNVGIGTATPVITSARLSIKANGDYDSGLAIGSNASAANWARLDFKNTNAANPTILFQDQSGAFSIRTDGAYPIQFLTNGNNERARIDSSGNLLVGKTTTDDTVVGVKFAPSSGGNGITVGSGFSWGLLVNRQSDNGTAIQFRQANNGVGSISVTNTLTTYNVSSDYRLKENIIPLTNALEKISYLKPSLYNYKADPSTNIEGFIAHELQEVVPHAVTGEKDAVDADGNPVYQGVDASFLIPHLVAAIQELKAEIDALKASK